MSYVLIVDIGNSQIDIGLFNDEEFVDKFRFDTEALEKEYEYKLLRNFVRSHKIDAKDIKGGLIFSVVPHITRLVQIIIKGELDVELPIFNPEKVIDELKSDIDNPSEIGQDLLADIVGAIHYYGCPVVVSDLGTVTKNLIIDKDGIFQGASFFPGVKANARILNSGTALLPELKEVTKPDFYFGKNTIDAMRCGIFYSHASAIKRCMDRADEEYGYKFKKVITGGYSNIFKEDFAKDKYIVDPDLVLKGMYLIYKNQSK